ncbi:MAG: hypothetical protein K2L23_04680 [Odoribacter sp.]|nr:hypothetical protein [Odoribacter sp.]
MKKLTKNNLARMAILLPELNAEHQRGILGGTAVAIGTPDYTEMIPVPTVVTSTVDPYAMTESIAIPVSTAPVPTTTVSPVVSTTPVPTVTMAPMETSESVSSIVESASLESSADPSSKLILTAPVLTSYMTDSKATGIFDSTSFPFSSSFDCLEEAIQWLCCHSSSELSAQGAITYGANFAGELKKGLGLEISPKYAVLGEVDLSIEDGLEFDGMNKECMQFGISYGIGMSYNQTKEANNTINTFSLGAFGAGITYSYDTRGNNNVYIGGDIAAKIAWVFGLEGRIKAGFNINW